MDDTTLQKLLQTHGQIGSSDFPDKFLADRVLARLPSTESDSSVASSVPLLVMFAAMTAIAVAIGTLIAPTHQHHHSHQPPAPPAMNGFDSSTLLVAR